MNKILESCKFVADNAEHISIDNNKIKEFCINFNLKESKHWLDNAPFDFSKLNQKEHLHFLLIFDSLNFCYWGNPKWTVSYNRNFDGCYGMITALKRALDKNIPILNPEFLANLNEKQLSDIFQANTQIPLFDERLKILHEIGKVLLDRFDGDFRNLIKLADNDTDKLLNLIIENFPNFNDTSSYKGKEIFFYKRAQLLVLDINLVLRGFDISKLTACADYKIPQILRKLGILVYSDSLEKKVDNRELLKKDSNEEIEIRACMVWAVELIKQKLQEKFPNISSIDIDNHLWLLGQEKSPDDKPYHLTLTIAY